MNPILIFAIAVVLVVVAFMVFARIVYKKSVIVIMTFIIANLSGCTAMMGFIIAHKGWVHLWWSIPTISLISVLNFWLMFKHLRQPVNELSHEIVDKLSKGDLNFEFDQKLIRRKTEFGVITKALVEMKTRLNEIVIEIQRISSHVSISANQQSDAATLISQGANEQASTTEEIAATIEEISASNHENSENANSAATISTQTSKSMLKLLSASNESLKAINNIVEKINVVDDIAYQTNILALNASVEAARAGDQGRGFSVVAKEVRSLAENSKSAATDIQNLSVDTIEITQSTASIVEMLQNEIEKSTMLVAQIKAASNEQTIGTDQIGLAIQQLNEVSQQNAASSEELASSSEELASQADSLSSLIKFFKTKSH